MAGAENVTPTAAVAGDTRVGVLLRDAAFDNRLECVLSVLLNKVYRSHARSTKVEIYVKVSFIHE